jgi:hypothetical protein
MAWGRPVICRNKQLKAQVWCDYDSDKADISIAFYKAGKFLSKSHVATVKPGDVWINEVAGRLQWASDSNVRLYSKNGVRSWDVPIPAPGK